MMNKIFIGLLFLIFVGAGVLFWLMKTLPTVESIPLPLTLTEGETKEGATGETTEGTESHGDEKPAADHATVDQNHDSHAEKKDESEAKAVELGEAQQKLSIRTEPVQAQVFVNDKQVGTTPFDVLLGEKKQTIRLEAEGFKSVMREAPAISQKGHDVESLNWKITLRALKGALEKSPRAHGEVGHKAPAVKEVKKKDSKISTELFVHGKTGPFWIQLKAFNVAQSGEVKDAIQNFRSQLNLNVVGCDVNLGAKGTWTRLLVGPFAQKAMARSTLRAVESKVSEKPFLTGVQACE